MSREQPYGAPEVGPSSRGYGGNTSPSYPQQQQQAVGPSAFDPPAHFHTPNAELQRRPGGGVNGAYGPPPQRLGGVVTPDTMPMGGMPRVASVGLIVDATPLPGQLNGG